MNVLDANDNPPSLDTVIANVTEERLKGEFVTQIKAIDSDQGTNGEVEYSLNIRGNQSLKIDPKTGRITTKVKFDYEEQRNYTFEIIATDKGKQTFCLFSNYYWLRYDVIYLFGAVSSIYIWSKNCSCLSNM